MKKTTLAAVMTAALVLPTAAFAFEDSNMDYTFAEFGFTDRDFDDVSADGFMLKGSYAIDELLYVVGGYTNLSGNGADLKNLSIGAGAAVSLNEKVDGYAQLSLISSDVGPSDDTGFGLEVGARSMVRDQVEAFGNVQYVDLHDDTDVGFEVGGRYWYQSNLGFSISYSSSDFPGNGTGLTFGARYNF